MDRQSLPSHLLRVLSHQRPTSTLFYNLLVFVGGLQMVTHIFAIYLSEETRSEADDKRFKRAMRRHCREQKSFLADFQTKFQEFRSRGPESGITATSIRRDLLSFCSSQVELVRSFRGSPGLLFTQLQGEPSPIANGIQSLRRLSVTARRRDVVPLLNRVANDMAITLTEQAFHVSSLVKDFQTRDQESDERKRLFAQRVRKLVRKMKEFVDVISDNMSVYGQGYSNSAAVATSITVLPPIWQKLDQLYSQVEKLCQDFGGSPATTANSVETRAE